MTIVGPVVVSGTDTGVGKTITTAAIAAAATRAGLRVAVLKPSQTGIPEGSSEESDVDTVIRLAFPASATTLATYPDPLAPATAARVSGRPALPQSEVVNRVKELQAGHDLVLIEGAGGLLVPMGPGWDVADLALDLAAPVVVVARAGLGTLNHTALTFEALSRRDLDGLLVIGAWPQQPDLVHRTNLEDLPVPLDGVLAEGAGQLTREVFGQRAGSWLSPRLHGSWHS